MIENAAMIGDMDALVLSADRKLEMRRVGPPRPAGARSVLVRIAYAGICGSDIHRAWHGGAYHYPLIMGHELSGVVERATEGGRLAPGTRVTVFPLLPCYRCQACQTGDYAQCERYDYFGSRRDGGFAELLEVPEENLLPLPPHLGLREAALTEPCAVALHGVGRLEVRPGDSGAVFGGGPIGNMAAQWLRLRGAEPVLVVDVDPAGLERAESMGLTPVDARGGDPVERIRDATGGGARCTVEAVGLPLTFLQALQAAGRGGQVLFMGNLIGRFEVGDRDFSQILRRELVIRGTWNSRITPRGGDDWSVSLARMERDLRIAPLVTHTPSLEEGPEVFRRLAEGGFGPHGRVVFRIGGEEAAP